MAPSTKPREQYIEANGFNFHFLEWGDPREKNAIIFLHGYIETSKIWLDVGSDLGREFRTIAIDARGYGKSQYAPNQDYSRTAQIEDLEAIIENLKLRSVKIVGQAMGGATAICYAAEHPEMVSALVLIAAAPEVLRSGMESARRLLSTAEEFPSMAAASDAVRPFYPYATSEQLERRINSALHLQNGRYRWNFDPAFRDPTIRPAPADPTQKRYNDLWDSTDKIQCPVMLVRGAETDMMTPEAVQRLHRRIVGSRISLIEGAGHPVPTDQPSMLSLNIREFLQSLTHISV